MGKGVGGEGGGLYIGTGWGRNGRALTRIEEEKLLGGNGLWRQFRSREEEPNRWVPLSVGEREKRLYQFRNHCWAAGCLRYWAGFVAPGPFVHFFLSSFSFFCFLISILSFANMIQIKPNQFHKFCRIHSKGLNQYETCFQNQNKIFNKRS
jgi:hypothetical protein